MKAHIHAESSAKAFGGKPEDYLAIHEFIDCSKGVIADHRHRALTHNTWFIMHVLPRVFGDTIKNSKGKKVSVREIGEQHVLEDFRGKFVPSAQDFLQAMAYEEWMNNGAEYPPSHPKSKKAPPPVETEIDRIKRMIKDLQDRATAPPAPVTWPPDTFPLKPQLPGRPEITDHWPPNGGLID
jgi:hypothetical protein